MKFEFIHRHDAHNTVQHSFQELAWPEVADYFFEFLKGCGYQLERQDLSDHFFVHNDFAPKETE